MLALSLAGCSTGSGTGPVEWWHDLQGGIIAADRPPPPGADQAYPHLGTIPARPTVPSASFRQTLQTRLTEQRDDTQRLAASNPIDAGPASIPPPPQQLTKPADDTANATLPGADSPPPKPTPAPASAPASQEEVPADFGPAPGTPVTLAGAPLDESTPNLPPIPDAPPPPASFEGVPALPAPTPPPPLPAHLPPSLAGSTVLFRPGDATLDHSQIPTLKDAAAHRGKGHIDIEGHGDTASDSPTAQENALALGLKRAQAIATALAALHVPQDSLRLSATAFGRDAAVRVIP